MFPLPLFHCRVVVHSKVNKSDYSTLSLHGVTRMIAGRDPEFTDLDQWVTDLNHFNKLVTIGTFAKFRMWKAFATWRKNVRSRQVISSYITCMSGLECLSRLGLPFFAYSLASVLCTCTMYFHAYIHYVYM